MNMRIIAIGKLRKTFLKNTFDYYLRRARKYFKIDLIELRKSRYKTSQNIDLALRKEKDQVVARTRENDYRIVLDERGVELSTRDLVRKIGELEGEGQRRVSFFLGGPFGVDGDLRGDADFLMAISKWTLPHELARVLLIEQLYRCGTVIAGEKYHK